MGRVRTEEQRLARNLRRRKGKDAAANLAVAKPVATAPTVAELTARHVVTPLRRLRRKVYLHGIRSLEEFDPERFVKLPVFQRRRPVVLGDSVDISAPERQPSDEEYKLQWTDEEELLEFPPSKGVQQRLDAEREVFLRKPTRPRMLHAPPLFNTIQPREEQLRLQAIRDPRRMSAAQRRAQRAREHIVEQKARLVATAEKFRSRSRSRILSLKELHKRPRHRSPKRAYKPRQA